MTVSIGVSLFPDHGQDAEELFRNANSAMRRAKALGNADAQVFEPLMNDHANARLKLEADLRVALERDFDEAQQREQAREGLEDFEQVFAEVFGREPVRHLYELFLQLRRAGRLARGEDEAGGLRALQLAFEQAAEARPRGEADRV